MKAASRRVSTRFRQHGVAALEFALIFLFGLLPLLMLSFTGVLVFAAQQSLTLAAAEGSRAALRYAATDAGRTSQACAFAKSSMQWLLDFSGQTSPCATAGGGLAPITVQFAPCVSDASVRCVSVITAYDYDRHPFLPGTAALFHLTFGNRGLRSAAVVQLEPNS